MRTQPDIHNLNNMSNDDIASVVVISDGDK